MPVLLVSGVTVPPAAGTLSICELTPGPVKASVAPSIQVGCVPWTGPGSCVGDPPVDVIVQRVVPSSKAIIVPSGEKDGLLPGPSKVAVAEPSLGIV